LKSPPAQFNVSPISAVDQYEKSSEAKGGNFNVFKRVVSDEMSRLHATEGKINSEDGEDREREREKERGGEKERERERERETSLISP
jgi:hypothetical protein